MTNITKRYKSWGEEVEIENGVPLPPKANCMGWTPALRKLKVGQSLLMKGKKKAKDASAFFHYAGLTGKATARVVKGGVRVWRIK